MFRRLRFPTAARWVVLLAVVGVVVGLVSAGWAVADDPAETSPPPHTFPPTGDTPKGFVGAAGCSATACHGGPAPSLTKEPVEGCWQGSATHWQACDPHQRAYEALKGTLAKQIITGLGWKGEATEHVRCLACHTTPQLATADHPQASLRAEGVSCEACHGEASGWQYGHAVAANRPTPGMTDLHDIGVRAKMCVGCHVGAEAADGIPVRDMNHDMIAAGHPRLDFDFADSHNRLPKHWYETKPKESHLWLIGRLAHAEAACELLASRASRQAPWPEFAEYNCGSCHHAIPDASRSRDDRLRWQTIWPLTSTDDPQGKGLQQLVHQMSKPDPDVSAGTARDTATGLEKWRGEFAAGAGDVAEYFPPDTTNLHDRDDLYQLLRGLAAFERDRKDDRPMNEKFEEAFGLLKSPRKPGDPIPDPAAAKPLLDELLRAFDRPPK